MLCFAMRGSQAPIVLACFVSLIGCEREGVHAYRVPREPSGMTQTALGLQSSSQESADRDAIHWSVPQGWREDRTPREFRLTTFFADSGKVEISVSAFAGAAGGISANINRWRSQLQLQPLSESVIDHTLEMVEGSEPLVRVFDETNGQRIVAAIVAPGDGQTWFIKAMGTPDSIGGVRQSLVEFATSLRLANTGKVNSAPSPTQSSTMNSAVAGNGTGAVERAVAAWSAPGHWRREQTNSQMVAAVWATDSGCRVTLTPLRRDAMTAISGINMWRSQIGLPVVGNLAEADLEHFSDTASLFDAVAEDGEQRIVAAIVQGPVQNWYIKLTGSATEVDEEIKAVRELVQLVDTAEHGS